VSTRKWPVCCDVCILDWPLSLGKRIAHPNVHDAIGDYGGHLSSLHGRHCCRELLRADRRVTAWSSAANMQRPADNPPRLISKSIA
jgi:hypothetical protein